MVFAAVTTDRHKSPIIFVEANTKINSDIYIEILKDKIYSWVLSINVSQGSVLVPLLFNIYTYDMPSMISRKFAYADNLALLHSSGNWKDLEGTLSQDMYTLSAYLQTWRLKLSHTKTVTAAFHLNNREDKRELKVYNNSRLLPFCPTPTYLGGKTGQIAHVSSPSSGFAQKTILPRHTAETTRGLGMGCWCKTLRQNTTLRASLLSQCSHSPHRQCLERRLAHSYWMPASHSNGPPTYIFRHPSS